MPNSSRKQKELGLEDDLRKMILGNVRVQDHQPHGPVSPERQHRNQSPRGESFKSPKLSNSSDHNRHQKDMRTIPNSTGKELSRNGSAPFEQSASGHRHANDREAYTRPPPRSRQLYQPNPRGGPRPPPPAIFIAQCEYLDRLASTEIAQSQMSYDEYSAKETYRNTLERGFQQTLQQIGLPGASILALQGFGSFSSGFATANSDVDLAVVLRPLPAQTADQFARLSKEMPRLLEKALLDAGFGARLLDRTRVPIIKTCQAPTPELLDALREERTKWDKLPDDEKWEPKLRKETEDAHELDAKAGQSERQENGTPAEVAAGSSAMRSPTQGRQRDPSAPHTLDTQEHNNTSAQAGRSHEVTALVQDGQDNERTPQRPKQKTWLRERPRGPLDFPKDGVGIQADINFSNSLALHNTELLRCYSLCDPRVQPMVLFVKAWAKRRKINSSYNGTLSSYGYVLMVLHFLVNVVQPPVVPNLQLMQATLPQGISSGSLQWQAVPGPGVVCDGYNVKFWRDPEVIKQLASRGLLTQNQEPLGVLLRNFFHHYAHQGNLVIGRGFQWTSEVLSLRTRGGVLTKEEKGWTGAKTTTTENREVRHRYLFAIEDPFELDHNVARTVTHHGIVAIRDEFRRAWRILMDVGNGREPQPGHLFDPVVEDPPMVKGEQDHEAVATAPEQPTMTNAKNDAAFLQTLSG